MDEDIIRKAGFGAGDVLRAAVAVFGPLLRTFVPVVKLPGQTVVLRYDDVFEVLERDEDFRLIYRPMLDIILGGEPFILGMERGAALGAATETLRTILGDNVKGRFAAAAGAEAKKQIAMANGGIEVVAFVRSVSGHVFARDFGTALPAELPLDRWLARMFEYIFVNGDKEPAVASAVAEAAPRLRAVVDALIASRKADTVLAEDMIGRALAAQRSGGRAPSDAQIRTMLIGLLIGGPPQVPMAAPQALAQLLRRPDALARARTALEADGEDALMPFIMEALRFDPLAPFLQRDTTGEVRLAAASGRPRKVDAGSRVLISPLSAMRDGRRIAAPGRFDENRDRSNFLHFSHGLHHCFGRQIVEGILPAILGPLIAKPGLRAEGGLVKRGIFAHSLRVVW